MKRIIFILFTLIAIWGCQKQPIYKTKSTRSPSLTLQKVNVGTAPNDGTGDPIRTAFQKQNTNVDALETFAGTLYTAAEVDQAVVDYFDGVIATAGTGVSLPDSLSAEEGGYTPYYTYLQDQYAVSQPTYHIQLIAGTIFAHPGLNTGYSTIYSGSELAGVINSVVAVVDSGAVIQVRNGHYNLTDSILLKSYLTYDFIAKARVCARDDYAGPIFYKPVATALRGCTVRGGYFYSKIGEGRDWNFCNLRSSSSDYPATKNRFLNIEMYYLKNAFEWVTTGSGWINANIVDDIICWSPAIFLRAQNTSSNEISYNIVTNILVQSNTWTTHALNLIGKTIFNQFVNVQCIDFVYPMLAISTTADVSELNYFSGCFGYGGEEISDLGDHNFIINGGDIVSSLHTQGNVVHKPKSTGNVVAETGITAAMLSRIMIYNGDSAIDITADLQIPAGLNGQVITIIGSSNTNTLKLDDDDADGKLDLNATITLGDHDSITLLYIGDDSTWIEIGRSNN